jgi:hypothetical protein
MSFDKKNRGITKAAKDKPEKASAKELKQVKPIKVEKKGKRVYKP